MTLVVLAFEVGGDFFGAGGVGAGEQFDGEAGVARALKAVEGLAGKAEQAAVIVDICLTVSAADEEIDPRETEVIGRICQALSVPPPKPN